MHSIYTNVIYRNQNQNTAIPRVEYMEVLVHLFIRLKFLAAGTRVTFTLDFGGQCYDVSDCAPRKRPSSASCAVSFRARK